MRRIEQPGPAMEPRVQWAECHGLRFRATLQPGLTLLEAVRRSFAAAGFVSGVVKVDGLALQPFVYVMPALATTTDHAAFYSDVFKPSGVARLDIGAMTFGERDGAPFFHCHALWKEGDGKLCGGHIMPDETMVAEEITLDAVGIDGARFGAQLDDETHFKLFVPQPDRSLGATRHGRFFAIRVRPNIDLFGALEQFCAEHGVARATIHGGVGSTIGARFEDGRTMDNFATEVAITQGTITADGAGSVIDVALVDYTGAMASGRLKRGDNPVLMTFELVLEAV